VIAIFVVPITTYTVGRVNLKNFNLDLFTVNNLQLDGFIAATEVKHSGSKDQWHLVDVQEYMRGRAFQDFLLWIFFFFSVDKSFKRMCKKWQ